MGDVAARGYAVGQPDVAADDRAVAQGDATEDGGAGIDHHVVLNDGMARLALFQLAVFTDGEALGAQRDGLVEADPIADDGSFADDNAGAVIDEKTLADGGAGMP